MMHVDLIPDFYKGRAFHESNKDYVILEPHGFVGIIFGQF